MVLLSAYSGRNAHRISGLPKPFGKFWSDAMSTAAYLIARSPASGLRGKTPYGKIFKRKVDASWFRPFGCVAYALRVILKGKDANLLCWVTQLARKRTDSWTSSQAEHSTADTSNSTRRAPHLPVDLRTNDTLSTPEQWEEILRTKSRPGRPTVQAESDDDLDPCVYDRSRTIQDQWDPGATGTGRTCLASDSPTPTQPAPRTAPSARDPPPSQTASRNVAGLR
ncbi:hypothetical protein C8R47DRAFT_1283312 [Mycena vitilis]|nr:hypothetical protein C8R47DRAFT_1283312 [Mycena vitilis]